REKFAEVVEKYQKSVLLIYLEEYFVKKDGTKEKISAGWGSGWIVRSNGIVVTNKHVAESWKFREIPMALLKMYPGSHIETDYFAWPAGERFLAADNKSHNKDTGYNNTKLKNLKFLGSVPDDVGVLKNCELFGKKISVQVQKSNDTDLAVLQLKGDSFTPIPVKKDPTTMKALDPVLLLGFPHGGQILDAGRADVSGCLGTIRFVSGVVSHTASAFKGNSGGPLLALDGEVIGVLTRGPGETLNEAIRSDEVLKFLERYP
ncbi:MAG: serine protease, partial [Planctomycetales bacterium]